MVRSVLLLTIFAFLIGIKTAFPGRATTKVPRSSKNLQKFLERLEKDCDFHASDEIYKELKNLWAKVMKEGNTKASSGTNDVKKLLKKLIDAYNKCSEKRLLIDFENEWVVYLKIFGKEYTATEKEKRKAIFKKNKENVERHNKLFYNGSVSYSVNLNPFSDWTEEELKSMNGFRAPNETHYVQSRRVPRLVEEMALKVYYHNPNDVMPHSVDWRKKGYVNSVAIQGTCGSCYAFAGVAVLEAYHKKITGLLVRLSVQNILDCTWHLGNQGCDGGVPSTVFDYAKEMGVVQDFFYPYTMNASHNCLWEYGHVVARDNGFYHVEYDNELALMNAVANRGPVAVSIGTMGHPEYTSGVFTTENCGDVGHSELVVGYGTDPVQGEYWILKNCWGFWWGEAGYMRIARNRNNMCNIASYGSFPY